MSDTRPQLEIEAEALSGVTLISKDGGMMGARRGDGTEASAHSARRSSVGAA